MACLQGNPLIYITSIPFARAIQEAGMLHCSSIKGSAVSHASQRLFKESERGYRVTHLFLGATKPPSSALSRIDHASASGTQLLQVIE